MKQREMTPNKRFWLAERVTSYGDPVLKILSDGNNEMYLDTYNFIATELIFSIIGKTIEKPDRVVVLGSILRELNLIRELGMGDIHTTFIEGIRNDDGPDLAFTGCLQYPQELEEFVTKDETILVLNIWPFDELCSCERCRGKECHATVDLQYLVERCNVVGIINLDTPENHDSGMVAAGTPELKDYISTLKKNGWFVDFDMDWQNLWRGNIVNLRLEYLKSTKNSCN